MSRETFDSIFEQVRPYARLIGLYIWGEPFLNKNLLYMASRCAAHGIYSSVDSNLTLRKFSGEEAEEIVQSGLSQIYASIDGATQETYAQYRVGGRLDRALNNLRQLVRAKKRLGLKTPHLGWNFLINKFNEHEMERAQKMADDLGVPIRFELMSCGDPSWLSSYHKQPGPEDGHTGDNNSFQALPLPVNLDQMGLHPNLFSWCEQPFSWMVINWDGNVMPCCTVFGDEYSLGNLLHEHIEDVWNNSKFRACRKYLYNYGPPPNSDSICETLPCPLIQKHL
jgi:radical SAM protein with 4Fe4S-binding SPASM domain